MLPLKRTTEVLNLFLIPMTLETIAQLNNPIDRVPLAEKNHYDEGLELINGQDFGSFQFETQPPVPLQLQMVWKQDSRVRITEEVSKGILSFSCSQCLHLARTAKSCRHQWASYLLLWQALQIENNESQTGETNSELLRFSKELKQVLAQTNAFENVPSRDETLVGVELDSVSLFLDEPALLNNQTLGRILTSDFGKYRYLDFERNVSKDQELLSPRLWNLPEIFRQKPKAYSEHYFNEVNKQVRMVDMVRYNFSNGMQISAKEILRHPLYKKVPLDLLPQGKASATAFSRWCLTQQNDQTFVSKALQELEEIMQALLEKIALHHRRKKLDVYLQTKGAHLRALKIESLEFDPTQELDWRVDFSERSDRKDELLAEFKLVCFRKRPLFFFESFAVEPVDGVLVIHPWLREFSLLRESLAGISETAIFEAIEMPSISLAREIEAKTLLKYLRSRMIPVKIEGVSKSLSSQQSRTEIRLDENGHFYLQHEARVSAEQNILRRGWSTESALYLQILSQGLTFLMSSGATEIASRTGGKREWDLKLLKHLGILQYVFLEFLSFHFEGQLIDGTKVQQEELLPALYPKLQSLLLAGGAGVFVRDLPLTELCSKSVLACFDNFLQITLKSLKKEEAFYSEHGEVVLQGLVEREFRLIFELLKKMALNSGGETFKKVRTAMLTKISKKEMTEDPLLTESLFHFPIATEQSSLHIQGALESLQTLIPHGYKIFYKDQPLQELAENEFHVDFILKTEGEPKSFNWFELNPKFFLRGQEVDSNQFLSLGGGGVIEYDGKLFLVPQKQMPSLRRLENFWTKLQLGKVRGQKKSSGDKVYQLPRHQTLELLALRSSGVEIRGDQEWKEICEFYDSLGTKTRELKLPASMTAELKPYQVVGIQWLQDLYRLKLGALLADDMGLGKTLQTLSFLDDLRDKNEIGQTLIVVPSSLVFNWQQEVEKFTPKLVLTVFSNRDKEKIYRRVATKEEIVVIITYGQLMEHEKDLSQYQWKILIFDEAQNLKNITTKRTSAARSVPAQFKICLTGTPMENHYGEFFSLVDILVPGSLGKVENFRQEYVNTDLVTREQMADLKLKIKPLLLRRTKKEILDQLPSKQETKVSIAFEDRQKEIYRDVALSYNQRVQEAMATTNAQGQASVQLQMLTALLRLRQVCSDPAALPNVRYNMVPPKLETLLDSLNEIVESGESALVFTQFLQTLEHTVELLREAKIPVFVLHGGIATKQRQVVLSEFSKTKEGAVLVMTLKTGGVGLNLTKASYVFHLEPWWNPAVENQATDRVHRLGQNKAVQVFKYIMHESLEEKIEILKNRKDRKFQALFTTTEKDTEIGHTGNALTKQDFDVLLGID